MARGLHGLWRGCRRGALALALALAAAPLASAAPAGMLTVDLSDRLVAITSSFDGTRLVLFGAADSPGDIIMLLEGPPETATLHRKGRIGGVWLNRDSVTFPSVPGFYRIAATPGALARIPAAVRATEGIGLENLRLTAADGAPDSDIAPFRQALIRLRQDNQLYDGNPVPVKWQDDRLFRADLFLPANIPVGRYQAQILLFQNGQIVGRQITPLDVDTRGVDAWLAGAARETPAAYGLCGILLAVAAGLLANRLFRRFA